MNISILFEIKQKVKKDNLVCMNMNVEFNGSQNRHNNLDYDCCLRNNMQSTIFFIAKVTF